MSNFFKVVEVASKSTYAGLAKKSNTMYLVKDTKEVFLGENAYGVSVEFTDTLPSQGVANKLYVKSGDNKGVYSWNGTDYQNILDGSITTKSFADGILQTEITEETATDENIPTSKAVLDFIKSKVSSVLDFKAGVDIENIGDTFKKAKKGQVWSIIGKGDFLGVDFNIGDLIIFISNVSGDVKEEDFIKIDNTESLDILRKLSDVRENEIVAFKANGGIKGSGKIFTQTISEASTDEEIPSAKSVQEAISSALEVVRI